MCFALAQISQGKCDFGKFKVVGILEGEGWPSRLCQRVESEMRWEWKTEAAKGL